MHRPGEPGSTRSRTLKCVSVLVFALLVAGCACLGGCDQKSPTAAGGTKSASQSAGPTGTAASGAASNSGVAAPPVSGAVKRVAVVPKGTTHEYWKSIHAGARKAERELGGIQITFRGPAKEDDREQQIALMENLISSRYDAIVLAPLDDRALVGPVRSARDAKIPVVIMDSGLEAKAGEDYASFVATDNEKGGRLAGERLGELLKGRGKVVLLRYQEGSASTALREKGFVDALAGFKDIQLIDPKRFAGPTRDTAQQAAENLLSNHADLAGVFCPNESSTFGMMLALRSRGLAGKVAFLGFDSSAELVDAMRKGEISGLVVQNPIRMGYLAVKAAADVLAGRPVEPRIDTGVQLITKENMDTPESKEILSPDLKSLLGS
ncbi:MAG: substrate-binding domain-containing protein [Phycisphaerae bacterium]|nr:substrate-binding domain-containing protein [Phycisphaerae bacterium]